MCERMCAVRTCVWSARVRSASDLHVSMSTNKNYYHGYQTDRAKSQPKHFYVHCRTAKITVIQATTTMSLSRAQASEVTDCRLAVETCDGTYGCVLTFLPGREPSLQVQSFLAPTSQTDLISFHGVFLAESLHHHTLFQRGEENTHIQQGTN